MQSEEFIVNVVPPLFEDGGLDDFTKSGRTLGAGISPRDDGVVIYIAPTADTAAEDASYPKEQNIYLASPHRPPLSERQTFIADTSIIWKAVRKLLSTHRPAHLPLHVHEETTRALNKLANDYIIHCHECCAYASSDGPHEEPLQLPAEHYAKLYSCFALATLLYMPDWGHARAPVGDELLSWLNTHYIQPSTEEGDHLSQLERPWEDDSFWPYLTRTTLRALTKPTVFFLEKLTQHPSTYLQTLAQALLPLVETHPRVYQYRVERDHLLDSRRWHDRLQAVREQLDAVPEEARGRNDPRALDCWWERFSDVLSILQGHETIVKRACAWMGADWKEACAAWAIYVSPGMRRDALCMFAENLLNEFPQDPTNLEDVINACLMIGETKSALRYAAELDIWLAAHLADFWEALEMIDLTPDDSELTLREQYTVMYAEYVHSNPGMWGITVDYLFSCGDVGRAMADEVLMRVPLHLEAPRDGSAMSEELALLRSGVLAGKLKVVLETCFDYQREEVRRAVCRMAAQTFLKEKEYGLAVSYCTSAEDWPGLGRVVERVLDEFITQGPETFVRYVSSIAPSLQALRAQTGATAVFVHRLIFAVRLAEFHQRRLQGHLEDAAGDLVAMFREEIAPKAWWAVLLSSSVELLLNSERVLFTTDEAHIMLRRLEEIHIRMAQGEGEDYLSVLARTTKSGEQKHALQRLQTVRLALARYYARCGVINVGGKSGISSN